MDIFEIVVGELGPHLALRIFSIVDSQMPFRVSMESVLPQNDALQASASSTEKRCTESSRVVHSAVPKITLFDSVATETCRTEILPACLAHG